AEVFETTGLPPSKDTDSRLAAQILGKLLSKRPVENLPGVLLCREQVGNIQHLDFRIDRGVVAIRGVRHLNRAVPHLVHAADWIAKRATVDDLNVQPALRPGLDFPL